MKRIILIVCCLMLSLASFAQKYDTGFKQTHRLKISGKTTIMKGQLTYDGEEQLSMIYSDPEGDYFIIDGTQIKMNLLGKKATVDSDKVPMTKLQRATLLNCLNGNWEQAAKDNNAKSTVNEKLGFRTVEIASDKVVPRGGYKSLSITYRIKDGKVTRLVLEDAVGIEDTYEMQ